jgi:isocitrate dehydrogenase
MMLVHIDQLDVATHVHNAWLCTIEEGIHTYDIFVEGVSKQKVGTKEFAAAVVARLGRKPKQLKAVEYTPSPKKAIEKREAAVQLQAKKDLVGVDIFLDWKLGTANDLGKALQKVNSEDLELTLITNRGAKVWPNGLPETFTTDHWRCRFLSQLGTISHAQITNLLERVASNGFDFIKIENLYNFDGQPGYSSVSGA